MKALARLIAPLSLLLVVAVVYYDADDRSPGELSEVHARISELAGADGCDRCHGDEPTAMRDGCESCHTAITEQRVAKHGFHGTLTVPVEDCAACHTEHHGAAHATLNAQSFAKAGVAGADTYTHARLEFRLTGAHTGLACERCHANANVQPLPAGVQRFLGADQACATCHRDPHEGEFGDGCARCHGQDEPFEKVARFAHDARFPLAGVHAGVACGKCHEATGPLSVSKLIARGESGRRGPVRGCAVCHRDPHEGEFGDGCARCHGQDEPFEKVARFAHDARFPLAGVHAGVACGKCHEATGPLSVSKLIARGESGRRGPVRGCAVCHDSPHRGSFTAGVAAAVGTDAEQACATCHSTERAGWASSMHEPGLHLATGFPLVAPHAKLQCADCHAGASFAERYPGRAAQDCRACHGDPHRGELAKGPFAKDRCVDCHAPHAFTPANFAVERHAKTRFPLDGAHAAVPCSACHDKPADGPRSFAVVGRDCASCHADAHTGYFARSPLARATDRAAGCDACHDTVEFANAAQGFDHGRYTRYPLQGAHARARCDACHPRSTKPDHNGRRFGQAQAPGGARFCATCHDDVHAGQFRVGGVTDCSSCHLESDSFSKIKFDHQRDARFKLDADHAKLACSACHRSYDVPGGGKLVRYKPLGRECRDCHTPGGSKRGH